LVFELRSQDGDLLAINHLDLSIFPDRSGAVMADERVPALYTKDKALATRLAALGYRLVEHLTEADAVIINQMTPELQTYVEKGGRVLFLAGDGPAKGAILPQLTLEARRGTGRDGDWASSFSWVKRGGAYAGLPGGLLIDHAFDRVIPDYVITGLRDWEFPAQVKAGMVVGWIHKPSALIAERQYGQGKVVVTTFRLTPENLLSDPTTTTLLDALIGDTVKGKAKATSERSN
jgi:hypothetical protein